MTRSITRKPLLTLAALAISGSIAFAQAPAPAPAAAPATPTAPVERRAPEGHRGMPQGRPGMRPGMMQNHRGGNDFHRSGMVQRHDFHGRPGDFHGPEHGGMEGGFHIAPPGMWWKNPSVVQKLTLTPEQTKKMDDLFQQSRLQLIDLKANLEKQNVMLEPMLSANPPDTAKALAQIDKVAQARADLEKADARMLLGIRGVLTPDQWTKLHAGGPGGLGRPAGPGGPGQGDGPGGGMGGHGGGHGPHGAGGAEDFIAPYIEP